MIKKEKFTKPSIEESEDCTGLARKSKEIFKITKVTNKRQL